MKNVLNKTVVLLLILSIFNCSKNDDGGSASQQNMRLKTYGVNANEYNFTYNADNKLTGYQNGSGNKNIIYNSEHKIIQIGVYNYTYNALGRLSEIDEGSNHADLIYNTQGLLATMNFRYMSGSSSSPRAVTRTFTYDTNNRLIEIEEVGNSDTYKTKVLLTYDNNNNVVQVKNEISNDLINYSDNNVISYTYDNKKNPNKLVLEKMGISDAITLYFLYPYNSIDFSSYAFFRALFFSNNNILSVTRTFSSGNLTQQYTYTYNANNYPIAGERFSSDSGGETQTTYYTWLYETIN